MGEILRYFCGFGVYCFKGLEVYSFRGLGDCCFKVFGVIKERFWLGGLNVIFGRFRVENFLFMKFVDEVGDEDGFLRFI